MDKNYQGIMVFFSGHGDLTNLLLSDYTKHADGVITGIYPRSDFISYFNGSSIRSKAQCHKLFFLDACRGNVLPEILSSAVKGSKGNPEPTETYSQQSHGLAAGHSIINNENWVHPEANRAILYSNPDSYASFEIVYSKENDDIAWHRLTRELYMQNDGKPQCGIFMNAVYHIFKTNAEDYGFKLNYGKIQDEIKKKAATKVPVYGDYDVKVGQAIEQSDTLDNYDKAQGLLCDFPADLSGKVKLLDPGSGEYGFMLDWGEGPRKIFKWEMRSTDQLQCITITSIAAFLSSISGNDE